MFSNTITINIIEKAFNPLTASGVFKMSELHALCITCDARDCQRVKYFKK